MDQWRRPRQDLNLISYWVIKLYACNPTEKDILILFGGHVQNFSHACPLIFFVLLLCLVGIFAILYLFSHYILMTLEIFRPTHNLLVKHMHEAMDFGVGDALKLLPFFTSSKKLKKKKNTRKSELQYCTETHS